MILMDNSLENLAKNNMISNKEACERATNPATMVQLIANVTIAKSKFLEVGPNSATILNDLIQFGILEEVSSTEVRLKPNADI